VSLLSKEELEMKRAVLASAGQEPIVAAVFAHMAALDAELAKLEGLAQNTSAPDLETPEGRTVARILKEREERAIAAMADNAARQAALSGVVHYLHIVQADMGGNHRYALMPGHGPAMAHAQHVESQPHPGAAVLERMKTLRSWAAAGLKAHHGRQCAMACGPYPESPAECESATCREWAKALEGA
jgi:hypothetical protein